MGTKIPVLPVFDDKAKPSAPPPKVNPGRLQSPEGIAKPTPPPSKCWPDWHRTQHLSVRSIANTDLVVSRNSNGSWDYAALGNPKLIISKQAPTREVAEYLIVHYYVQRTLAPSITEQAEPQKRTPPQPPTQGRPDMFIIDDPQYRLAEGWLRTPHSSVRSVDGVTLIVLKCHNENTWEFTIRGHDEEFSWSETHSRETAELHVMEMYLEVNNAFVTCD